MSAVITTVTPFLVQEVLINALTAIKAEPIVITAQNRSQFQHRGILNENDILTNRVDYYGPQHFRYMNGVWKLRHDSSQMNGHVRTSLKDKQYKDVGSFLSELGGLYEHEYGLYQERLAEEERQRVERERQARVEATRQSVIEKARQQGYSVKERVQNGKIQLVLTRSV